MIILCSVIYNEAKILPYFIRHYHWVDKIFVWVDRASNDGSLEILKSAKNVEPLEWPHNTGLDDEQFIRTANHWPNKLGREMGAHWVGFVDADELLYHPTPRWFLDSFVTADIVRAKGYALISPSGYPKDDGRQIYEQVRSGIRQINHDKFLLWRPGFDIDHRHGRHETPGYGGRIDPAYHFKNIHCHHLEGVTGTADRNQRNLNRANEKQFAWNYFPENEALGIGGTAKWVADHVNRNCLFDVIEDPL